MLDFLFQLGQGLSLVALVSGLFLTIRYRKCVDDAQPTQLQLADIHLLESFSQSDQLAVPVIAAHKEPVHREPVAA